MTDGMAKMIMNEVTTCAQINNDQRLIDRPGARILNAVPIMTIAPTSEEISVNVIICAQMSTRFPGENPGPANGTYENHPASGPVFRMKPV